MSTLETAAMWAAVLSGAVTVGGATTALAVAASGRLRRWTLGRLGVLDLRDSVADLAERQEEVFETLDRELAAAADARKVYAAQILALAYAIESDDDVDLDIAAFAREQVAQSDGVTRAADYLEDHDLLRGADAADGG